MVNGVGDLFFERRESVGPNPKQVAESNIEMGED